MKRKLLTTILTGALVAFLSLSANAFPGNHNMDKNMYGDRAQHHYMATNGTDMMAGNRAMMNQARHNLRSSLGPQHYPMFDVDISDDLFVNPHRFMRFTGGMPFIDENGDGIADIVQDTELFKKLGIGPCIDNNNDTICDCFQTREAYRRMGMKNFVDVDGDGICDNYEMDPFEN